MERTGFGHGDQMQDGLCPILTALAGTILCMPPNILARTYDSPCESFPSAPKGEDQRSW